MTRGGPVLAQNDEAGDRFYTWKGEAFWSVTTIIAGGIPKYLHAHYAKMTAELAWAEMTAHGPNSRSSAIRRRLARAGRAFVAERQAAGALSSVKKPERLTDEEAGLRWLKGAAERHRDEAAQRGRDVHDEAEELVLEHAREASRLVMDGLTVRPWPSALKGYQTSFLKFVDDWRPEFIATEATVLNRLEAYGGTLDAGVLVRAGDMVAAIARAGDLIPAWLLALPPDSMVKIALDYKSGRQIYPEVGVQLAPYVRAEFVAGADGVTEFPMPDFQAGAVLHLRPKGYRFVLVRVDQPMFDVFRYAREVYRFRKELASTVFIADLAPDPIAEEVPA